MLASLPADLRCPPQVPRLRHRPAVSADQPGFFGDASDDDGKRGPEKKRQSAAYARQGPQELRPWAAAGER